MKALSLWQPWASLVAFGAKKYETRGWYTRYRGPLLIHASKRFARNEQEICIEDPFKSALVAGGITHLRDMPLGVLLCRVTLVDCVRIPEGIPCQGKLLGDGVLVRGVKLPPDGDERDFGNYLPGRFAWILQDVERLPTPLPCKGMQTLFDAPPLEELEQLAAEAALKSLQERSLPAAEPAPKPARSRSPQRDLFETEG